MVIEINRYMKPFFEFQNHIQKSMDGLFAQINLKPMMFLGIGVLMTLIGLFEIIGNGLSILLWVVVLFTGISAVKYGMEKSGIQLPEALNAKLSGIVE